MPIVERPEIEDWVHDCRQFVVIGEAAHPMSVRPHHPPSTQEQHLNARSQSNSTYSTGMATGDAAEAEFSDGFLKHAVRALERGWCVELLSWSQNISSSWREMELSSKWQSRFRIIELDDYIDELVATFIVDR